ncbi:MAG: metallopeptidase TldD-related protein [bacterium]
MTDQPSRAPIFGPGGAAEIDSAQCDRLLSEALDRGGDYADLFFEHTRTGGFTFEDGRVQHVGRGVSLGLGARVVQGEATGYAYSQDLEAAPMREAARTASSIASAGGGVAPKSVSSITPPSYYPVETPTLFEPDAQRLALIRRADEAARGFDPCVTKVVVSLGEALRQVLVATSDGRLVADEQPLFRFFVQVVAEREGKRQTGSAGGGGRLGLDYFDGRTPEELGREAARVALAMMDAREAPAGEMPVVLGPGDSGILLHEAVGHGLEADFNRKATSNYSGRIGEQVASPLCTVVDDATQPGARGSINVDDEGLEGGRTVLIERGILRGYMHDRLSARLMKTAATGNGRREDFTVTPYPRMTNTFLLGGEQDPEEIIRSVQRGIFACRFSGGQVNISNGDFVFSLTESYLIEEGKVTAPLRGVNLIGNGPDVLRRVSLVGNDFAAADGIWTCGKEGQSVPVGVGTPTIKLDGITVGGTQA